MNQIKGRFITLCGELMEILYPKQLQDMDSKLFSKVGKHWNALDPEAFYDVSIFSDFLQSYSGATKIGTKAISIFGRHFYPTVKAYRGLPSSLNTVVDHLQFESQIFMDIHRGPRIAPRRFVKVMDHEVVIETQAVGYDPILYQGVFVGVLQTIGIRSVVVTQTKHTQNSDGTNEYKITW